MSVELYAEEIVVVAVAEGRSDFKILLRTETPDDLTGDLRWLCEEYLDYNVIVDLTGRESFGSASYKNLLDLRDLAAECDFRLVLCGVSPHLKWQLKCVHLADEFDMFDTREAAITELSAGCLEP
jgi:anti-anti-sigma regulatory factor